jgi:predicted P-loop ATPase
MTQENVVQLLPTAPEPLTAGEIEFVSNALYALTGDIEPLAGLKDDEWAALVRVADTDPGLLNRIELKMRAKLHELNVKDASKFTLQKFRIEAKQNAKERETRMRQIIARGRRNDKNTKAGQTDQEIIDNAELPTDAQADAVSLSLTLKARSWLSANHKGRIWYDEFANNIFTNWDGTSSDAVIDVQPIDDMWRLRTYFTLMRADHRLGKLGEKAATLATDHMAFEDTRNALKEWLLGVTWDKVARLDSWLSVVYGVPQDDYHKAVGKNWVIGMVARIHRKGDKMDNMPVLIGGEGIRKSTSLEILGGKIKQAQTEKHYYGAITVSAEKMTDFLMTLNGLMVAEVAELDALMNRKVEHSRVKTLVTNTEDIYRAPYGHAPGIHKRTCVIAGTTNEFHWNNFEGVGRRFWPFECNRLINTDWLIENRDQLFAEAQARYAAGEGWHVVPMDQHQKQMAEHKIDDPIADRIERWLYTRSDLFTGEGAGLFVKPPGYRPAIAPSNEPREDEEGHWGNLITTSRVLTQALQMPVDKHGVAASRKIASVMRNLGWKSESVRIGSGQAAPKIRAWIRAPHEVADQGQLFDKTE